MDLGWVMYRSCDWISKGILVILVAIELINIKGYPRDLGATCSVSNNIEQDTHGTRERVIERTITIYNIYLLLLLSALIKLVNLFTLSLSY